jgi:uncharacterized protein YjbI with pentapeptide repeats
MGRPRAPARPRAPSRPKLAGTLSPAVLPHHDLADGGVLSALEYAGADLAGQEAAAVEIDQCRFRSTALTGTELDRAVISDSVFESCDLANLRAQDCGLLRVAVSGSRMTGLSWAGGGVRETVLSSCRMDLVSFRFTVFKHTVFTDCRLSQADFTGADLRGARFEGCDLSGAQFSGAQMTGTRFAGCTLDGISGVTSMRGAIVTGADALALAYSLASALGISIEDG